MSQIINSFWCCRLCLKKNKKTSEENGKDIVKYPQIQKMLSQLFSIIIHESDCSSTIICKICLKKVKSFFQFYNFVCENQKQLKTIELNEQNQVKGKKSKTNADSDEKTLSNYLGVEICDSIIKEEIEEYNESDFIDNVDFDHSTSPVNNEYSEVHTKLLDLCSQKENNQNEGVLIKNESIEDFNSEDSNFEFPAELIKNGKLMLKGSPMEKILRHFYDIRCELCEEETKFDSLFEMFRHYKSMHKIRGYIKCCNLKMKSRKTIIFHMAFHIQPSAFKCVICDKILSRPNLMKDHLKGHLPDSEKEHTCELCGKRFASRASLRTHMLIHVPTQNRTLYDCKYCGKQFKLRTSCNIHMATVHSEGKFLCMHCGKSYKCKVNLEYHLTSAHEPKKTQEKCPECGRICLNKRTLTQHMKIHNGERLHCTMCSYETYARKFLNKHIQIKHSENKPFRCNECTKTFKTKKCLQVHVVQHTGERKYNCEFCNKSFASSGNHTTHQKRMHPDQYTYKMEMLKAERYGDLPADSSENQPSLENQYETARKLLQNL